jgi:asparagine synthase (glutamine-hydrolysing)
MCGIAGFFNIGSPRNEFQRIIESMTGNLTHRGPDASGWWADPDQQMVLGHRRLSILDLSESGIQPMHSASGRFVISFNGEIYNFRELRMLLQKKGHIFKTGTDTEVILAAVEEWGIADSVKRFRGMFAYAVYDRLEKKGYLVRDRFGIKPCYYAQVGKGWMFASQIGAIKQHASFEANLDHGSLGLFLLLNHIPDTHCVYQKTFKVRPGEIVCFDLRDLAAQPVSVEYWNTGKEILESWKKQIRASDEECIEQVKSKIKESVKLRMIADVPLGAFLSGGIDSSLVVALMQELSSDPVNTFTIRNNISSYDEGDVAKAFAKHIGTNHTELMVSGKEAAEVLPLIADIYDEPFSDASQIPTYLVSKLARSAVTVSLSGDGGDEVFGGYNRYFRATAVYERYQKFPGFLKRVMGSMVRSEFAVSGVDFLSHFRSGTRKIRNAAEKLAKTARCVSAGDEMQLFLELLMQYHEGNALITGVPSLNWQYLKQQRDDCPLDGLDLTEQMMYQDTIGYLPNDILTKLDRASMAVALESRVPLLDHELFQLSWRLRPELKIRNGNGKWILKKILEPYLPDKAVLRGEKQGFAVPLGDWFRGDLKSWLCDTLSDASITRIGLLDAVHVEKLIAEHMSCKKNHENILWSLLVLHMWMDKQ